MQVSVNGRVIEERDIARETQYHAARSLDEARRQAATALVVRELLVQRAQRLGVEREGADAEALVQALIDREVSVPKADEAACRRYYEVNAKRFRSADLVEARHILLPVPPQDEQALAAARAKAQGIIDVLKASPERFADLARELSACPSAKQGGKLGQLSRGSTVPEVETFLFQLEEGQLCPVPVRSRYGYHVLIVDRCISGRLLPFEAVHRKIADYLEDRVWRQAARQYVGLLIGAADIKGIELQGSDSPLVQ
jgi:peptidyl-prolyl cis-trans isomerase C